jgi:hypothetical protein
MANTQQRLPASESNPETPAIETPPEMDEIHRLTFVDHSTHIQVALPNVLIITSCKRGRNGFVTYFTEASVRTCLQQGIAEAKRKGYESSDPRFILNYPTIYDPVKKKKTPKGLVFAWFADSAFPNIFMGLNADGSKRTELYPDPNWVAPPPDEWDEEEEDDDAPFDFSSFKFKPGVSWVEMQEEEDKKEAKKKEREPPMLSRDLPPLATLIVKQGAEDPEKLQIERGFAKIKKKVQDECDLGLLHMFIPSWADLADLMKTFAPFSCSSSYPLLEVVQDRDPAKCHLYVSYPPGSNGAISAQMILFKFTYSKGKNEEVIHVDYSKKGAYERHVEKAPHYKVLKLTPCMRKPPVSTVPQVFFKSGSKSTPSKSTPSKSTPSKSSYTPTKAPNGDWKAKRGTPKETKPKEEDGWTTKGTTKTKKTPCKTPPKSTRPPPSDGDDDGLSDLLALAKIRK